MKLELKLDEDGDEKREWEQSLLEVVNFIYSINCNCIQCLYFICTCEHRGDTCWTKKKKKGEIRYQLLRQHGVSNESTHPPHCLRKRQSTKTTRSLYYQGPNNNRRMDDGWWLLTREGCHLSPHRLFPLLFFLVNSIIKQNFNIRLGSLGLSAIPR